MIRSKERKGKNVSITPIKYINALGGEDSFDLDPAYLPEFLKPWNTAKKSYSEEENGLKKLWHGRVWLNPPVEKTKDSSLFDWVKAMADHNNGIMLINSTTDTAFWQDHILKRASSILFVRGKITFLDINGNETVVNRYPSAFVSYGDNDLIILKRANDRGLINGKLILL